MKAERKRPMTITVHGLKNCDTCRKARRWLGERSISYVFRDLRADGLEANALGIWCAALGWEKLLNKRGTTWRTLSAEEKIDLDQARAMALMLDYPALIKRPVFDLGQGRFLLGFGTAEQAALETP